MVLPNWSKTNWGKHVFLHVATATDGCNCKLGICALSWALPRFGVLLYGCRFVQHGVENCENTLLKLWKCFTVSPLRSACMAMHQTATRTKVRQLQRAFRTRWLSSEAAMSEILAIWAALKQLSEIKMMQCALFYYDLWKQNISTCYFPFVNTGPSPDRTEQSFSGGIF